MTTTWTMPIESKEWVGPITVTAKIDGTPTTIDPSAVQFALILEGTRPQSGDWTASIPGPGGTTGIGVQANPVTARGLYGIWVRFADGSQEPVLDPDAVGYIDRS